MDFRCGPITLGPGDKRLESKYLQRIDCPVHGSGPSLVHLH